MNNYDAIFFDFDGVILDSVDIKTRAFAEIFKQYGPDIESKVIEYHEKNGGVSRYDKFEYYYKYLLERDISQKEIDLLSKQFESLVLEKVIAAPFIRGALETLNELKNKAVNSFVVSGTPDKEIKHIINCRDLTKYFIEVHGSPRTKGEILNEIFCRYNYTSDKCLFIGDAMSDYSAAKDAEIKFLGIVKSKNSSPFPEGTNLSEIVKIL